MKHLIQYMLHDPMTKVKNKKQPKFLCTVEPSLKKLTKKDFIKAQEDQKPNS
jgi:hypothetical protein